MPKQTIPLFHSDTTELISKNKQTLIPSEAAETLNKPSGFQWSSSTATLSSPIPRDNTGRIAYIPLKCIRATGWKGPLELGASTTILSPDLLHVNI